MARRKDRRRGSPAKLEARPLSEGIGVGVEVDALKEVQEGYSVEEEECEHRRMRITPGE
jgi:hypothetical protein